MTVKMSRLLAAAVVGVALLPVMSGCSSNAPALTKQEQSSFKGGPMPASSQAWFQQRMQEQNAKAMAAAQQNQGQNQGQNQAPSGQ